jgi:hypothetical protein
MFQYLFLPLMIRLHFMHAAPIKVEKCEAPLRSDEPRYVP